MYLQIWNKYQRLLQLEQIHLNDVNQICPMLTIVILEASAMLCDLFSGLTVCCFFFYELLAKNKRFNCTNKSFGKMVLVLERIAMHNNKEPIKMNMFAPPHK